MSDIKKKRKRKVQKFTLSEFKVWLAGLSQFQSDDWHPNKEQWDIIYDHLMVIKEAENNVQTIQTIPTGPIPRINDIPAIPPVTSSAQAPMVPQVDISSKLKSDIDTSDGTYESDFI